MKITLALLACLLAAPAWADKESIERYFQSLDLDGDGYVSLSEAAGDAVVVSRFDRADRNKDGKLSAKEFANLGKVKVRVAKSKDKDKDRSAAVGGTTRDERKRVRAEKSASGG